MTGHKLVIVLGTVHDECYVYPVNVNGDGCTIMVVEVMDEACECSHVIGRVKCGLAGSTGLIKLDVSSTAINTSEDSLKVVEGGCAVVDCDLELTDWSSELCGAKLTDPVGRKKTDVPECVEGVKEGCEYKKATDLE